MADPLSAAAAASLAQAAIEHKKHVLCDVVAEHVRSGEPVTGYSHFWPVVAQTLKERHGISDSYSSTRKEYMGLRAWAVANRTGKDGDERKFIKRSLRRAARQQAAVTRDGGVVGEEGEGDDEENEDGGEGGEGPSAFHANLALRQAGPAQQQQQQQSPPPAGENITFSLPVRPKET
ncbi:hypothetical protein M409DRAFT_18798 [Zasmidium cellare ATCC 36951]|uniref:Uncharacterized protein n=1 Tax=Zasmidium cellare ATCC 36951 TaxID=1080233 RepID=A0A6A6CUV3_ZASCE|nr:uncharacterized protein M409DRAFT_18798 [Zasmidium cellare ATCC 36951]KAF2170825.1 hypothetical protein M409DRAFT_18798 [Zasmidium cellare ATCC 36951]